jgi:hypothetical protein
MNVSVNKYIVPTGLNYNLYFAFYQYVVPNGTVPEGRNIGRKISCPNDQSPVGTIYLLTLTFISRFLQMLVIYKVKFSLSFE